MHDRTNAKTVQARWELRDVDPVPVAHLAKNLDLPRPLARVLVARG
jgi:hypothetical protein